MKINGAEIKLNIRPDRIDFRDREYRPRVLNMPHQFPEVDSLSEHAKLFTGSGLILDQGKEGACTGFGLAAMINFISWNKELQVGNEGDVKKVSPRMLYNNARLYDEWDGEDNSGSSCRGAMKGWHKHGVCEERLFPYHANNPKSEPKEGYEIDAAKRPLGAYYRINGQSVVDMQAAITETGAIYLSAKVHPGWELSAGPTLEKTVIVQDNQSPTGGHAFAVMGYTAEGFIVQNSWGEDWGYKGFAILPYDDWARNGYDAWVATLGAPTSQIKPQSAKSRESLMDANPISKVSSENPMEVENGNTTLPQWDDQKAYKHMLVTGPGGEVLRRLAYTEDAKKNIEVVLGAIKDNSETCKDVVFFAFGGLQPEREIRAIIKKTGPIYMANGICPIFIVPGHGLLKNFYEIRDHNTENYIAQRTKMKIKGAHPEALKSLAEKRDSTFELRARSFLGLSLWSQVYRDAYFSSRGGVVNDICRYLGRFRKSKDNRDIRFHIGAHGVGTLFAGHLMDGLDKTFKRYGGEILTTTLWAPACSMEFVMDVIYDALSERVLEPEKFQIINLSDEHERADQVVDESLYGKSILYLASRALEDKHKTAMLGLQTSWQPIEDIERAETFNKRSIADIKDWRDLQNAYEFPSPKIVKRKKFSTGKKEIDVTHLNMLRDVDLFNGFLEHILGDIPKTKAKSLS